MAAPEDVKPVRKIPVWKSVGGSYRFLFGNLIRFAKIAVPLAVLSIALEFLLLRTLTGFEIYYFLFGWMSELPNWVLGGGLFADYEDYSGGLFVAFWSPLLGRSLPYNWSPGILMEAVFAVFWVGAFLRIDGGRRPGAKALALAAAKIFVLLWVFQGAFTYSAVGLLMLVEAATSYMISDVSIIFFLLSVTVAPLLAAYILCRMPLGVPAILAGQRRFGIAAMAAPGFFAIPRLLVALTLVTLPVLAADWLLATFAGLSYENPKRTDNAALNTVVQFGQEIATFAYFAVCYGVYARAWYVHADKSAAAGLSLPCERKAATGGQD